MQPGYLLDTTLRPVNIRLATGTDAAGIAGIYRPIVLSTPISFETEPPDEQEMRRRFQILAAPASMSHQDSGRLACTATWATSWGGGTTSAGGTASCSRLWRSRGEL